jgi:hypothetical protein
MGLFSVRQQVAYGSGLEHLGDGRFDTFVAATDDWLDAAQTKRIENAQNSVSKGSASLAPTLRLSTPRWTSVFTPTAIRRRRTREAGPRAFCHTWHPSTPGICSLR